MDLRFSLGQTGVTDYLIVQIRLVSDPGPVLQSLIFGPAPPTTTNCLFPGVDPDFYYVDVYESVDGIFLTNLFNVFEILARDDSSAPEYRFYVVDRGNTGDPVDASSSLVDAYLDGKTIASFAQRGVDKLRPLGDEWIRTGGGIDLVAPLIFSSGDTYCVEITNKITPTTLPNATPFVNEIDVTANSTLNSTHRNKLINCNGTGETLVIVLETLSAVPANTQYLFVDQEGGSQNQTKFVPQAGDFIMWMGALVTELWIGKGESLWLKKKGLNYKVIQAPDAVSKVGLRVSSTHRSVINVLPEDSLRYEGSKWPRIWWFLNNVMSADCVFIDNAMDLAGAYDRSVSATGRDGQFIISVTNGVFMMPDGRGKSDKGLKDFSVFGTDSDRPVDFPGGLQDGKVGAFDDNVTLFKEGTSVSDVGSGLIANGAGPNEPSDISIRMAFRSGIENTVKNIGVITFRYV